jgi:hypothetical protein
MADSTAAQDRPLRELRGVVERITYQNAENGFTVARLAAERPEAEAEAARRRSAGHGHRHPRRPDPRRGDRRSWLVAE